MKYDLCVVGLDISSTNVGVSIIDLKGNLLGFELISPKDKKLELRGLEILKRIEKIFEEFDQVPVAVGLEWSSFASKGRVIDLTALNGAVYYFLLKKGYLTYRFAPTTIKKFFTGNGRSKKEDMSKACDESVLNQFREKYKKLDDLVDSFAIAKKTLSQLNEEN